MYSFGYLRGGVANPPDWNSNKGSPSYSLEGLPSTFYLLTCNYRFTQENKSAMKVQS